MSEEMKSEGQKRDSVSVNEGDRVVDVIDSKEDRAGSNGNKVDVKSEPRWTGGTFSPKAFRFRTICLVLLTAALIFVGCRFIGLHCHQLWETAAWSACLGVPALLWIWLTATILYCRWTIRYQLDHERLLIKTGLFYQTTNTILIAQINDIQLVQTLWDKLVNGGVGTLIVYSSDKTDSVAYLRGLEKPKEAFESLDLLRKDYVRRRGIKSFGVYGGDQDDGGTDVGFF